MKNIKKDLISLCESVSVGNIKDASTLAAKLLGQYAEVKINDKNQTVFAVMNGERDYTFMVEAHIDQIAFTVTNIDDNGFLTLAKCGGFDLRILPATRVLIHGKETVKGVFCSTPPHLSKGDKEYSDIAELKVDSLLGKKAKDIISLGDFVTYDFNCTELLNDRISGGSIDNRAGCVAVIELARRLKGKKLPFNVIFCLADGEELGNRGAIPATYSIAPDEAVAIDVSFATAPDVSDTEAGELGGGAMLGFSPILNNKVTKKLEKVAIDNNIPLQYEVMGGRTSTDSDVISISRIGVKTGLLSIPLRNMHTPTETVDLKDIVSLCDILENYILSGGILND